MRKQEKNLLRRGDRVTWSRAGFLAAVLLAGFAAPGCSPLQKTDTKSDPLKGDAAITTNKTNVPPPREPASFTPPALAATGNLPGGGGLGFQTADPPGKNPVWQGNAAETNNGSAAPANTGIQLKNPVPVIQPTGPETRDVPKPPPLSGVMGVAKGAPISQAKPGPVADAGGKPAVLQTGMVTVNAPPPTTGSVIPGTYEELQKELKKRGVNWQGQETTDRGVKFSCSVPDRQNPARSRVYEAEAPDYLTAIRVVLQQIDRTQ